MARREELTDEQCSLIEPLFDKPPVITTRGRPRRAEREVNRESFALPKLEFKDAENLKGFEGLLNFKYENLNLQNYQSWGEIAAPVAV